MLEPIKFTDDDIIAAQRDLSENFNMLERQVMKLNKKEEGRIRKEIKLAFEAVKEIIKDPKKFDAMPRNSVLMPVKVKHLAYRRRIKEHSVE